MFRIGIKSRSNTFELREHPLLKKVKRYDFSEIYDLTFVDGLYYLLCGIEKDDYNYSELIGRNFQSAISGVLEQFDKNDVLPVFGVNSMSDMRALNEVAYLLESIGTMSSKLIGSNTKLNWLIAFKNEDEMMLTYISKCFGLASETEVYKI